MNYIQLTIPANEQEQELLIGLLADTPATGFEQLNDELLVFFKENDFNETEIKNLVRDYSFGVKEIKEENWNQLWESNFQPVVIGDFCAVRADFHAPITGVQHEILVTPKMSFGTGHHATTNMMIQLMQKVDFHSKRVFDFGTGTGILAILAEKQGAVSVLAIDNDEWSINNALENILKNQCYHIKVRLSSEVPLQLQFDVVVANINKNVILENLSSLYTILSPDGVLLLSGLLLEDEREVVNACTQLGLVLATKMQQHNWIAVLLKRAG